MKASSSLHPHHHFPSTKLYTSITTSASKLFTKPHAAGTICGGKSQCDLRLENRKK
ncbi:hypothetical protein Ahy_A10g047053 isoform E [Arachis hypogaea]|uniref:Uncharacterized protein n=1 Tax=Arachis hypogaea TaxID=3818 RepID=A0A445B1D6_ARAHY|nr:hypothetical protein Ahy_A10g047053 isoform E [Arachis hypogaea]